MPLAVFRPCQPEASHFSPNLLHRMAATANDSKPAFMGPMSIRAKAVSIAILATGLTLAAAAWVERERVVFVGKCWSNGNGVTECHCTYTALDELPPNYRDLAVAWAHEKGSAYAASVAYLVAAEAWRIGAKRLRRTTAGEIKSRTARWWIRAVGTKLGWIALRHVAPTTASILAPVAVAAPLVNDAVNELATAQRVLGRHCGTGDTFIVRLNDRIQAVAQYL